MDAGRDEVSKDWPPRDGAPAAMPSGKQRIIADFIRHNRAAMNRASIDLRLAEAGYAREDIAQGWLLAEDALDIRPPVAVENAVLEPIPIPRPERAERILGAGAAAASSEVGLSLADDAGFWPGFGRGSAAIVGSYAAARLLVLALGSLLPMMLPRFLIYLPLYLPVLVSLAVGIQGLRRRKDAPELSRGLLSSVVMGWIVAVGIALIFAYLIIKGMMEYGRAG